MSFKSKIARLFDDEKGNAKGELIFEKFISILIILNAVVIVLESYKGIYNEYSTFFYAFEVFSIIIFTIEYFIRIWIADKLYEAKSSFRARLKYITSYFGIIDLISILPFFLPFIFKIDLRILRLLRLFRLLRLLKLNRYFNSLRVISSVIKKTKSEIAVTVFLVFILLVLSSTLMYHIENEAQPNAFENIGQALWWAVATLTTVGYGDIYPVTGTGKLLSAIIALLGIGIVALPTGIISSAYIEEIQKNKKEEICKCPHCGKNINE